jgi:hypothetical protein
MIIRIPNPFTYSFSLSTIGLTIFIILPMFGLFGFFTWQEIDQQSQIKNMNCLQLQKWILSQNPSPDSAYLLAQHRFNWLNCEHQNLDGKA